MAAMVATTPSDGDLALVGCVFLFFSFFSLTLTTTRGTAFAPRTTRYIATFQAAGVDIFLSMGGWNYNCYPALYCKYSVGGYGQSTPNYWKIQKYGGGSVSGCTPENQYCYVCEPPSENTSDSSFSIFPGQCAIIRARRTHIHEKRTQTHVHRHTHTHTHTYTHAHTHTHTHTRTRTHTHTHAHTHAHAQSLQSQPRGAQRRRTLRRGQEELSLHHGTRTWFQDRPGQTHQVRRQRSLATRCTAHRGETLTR
jgi:hypothetical protein